MYPQNTDCCDDVNTLELRYGCAFPSVTYIYCACAHCTSTFNLSWKDDERSWAVVATSGFGRAGTIHFNGIRKNPRCRLKYVVDCFELPAVLQAAQAKLAEFRMLDSVTLVKTSDYESVVLADKELQAVVITVPTKYHESYAKRALLAGKAVFCAGR